MEILGLVSVPVWLLGIVVFLLSLYLYGQWKHSLWRRLGVPGPNPTPFIGVLGIARKKGFFAYDLECVQKYGKVFGTYFGHVPTLNVADPELVKQLLIKRFTSFPNRSAITPVMSELRGMLTAARDEHWKFVRNTLTPTFSSGKMRQASPAISGCCDRLLENIKEQSKTNKVLEFKSVFGNYTMDVIASTAFGIEVNSQKEPNNEFVRQAKRAFSVGLTSPLRVLIVIFPALGLFINFLAKLKIKSTVISEVLQFFKSVTISVMENRKAENEKRNDFIQLMINAHKDKEIDKEDKANMVDFKKGDATWRKRALTTDEVTANAFVFFLAGYDTTANTLSFLAYNLALHPDCQNKCIEEVDRVLGKDKPDYDNVLKLEYLDNCMNETLRMYGPAPFTNRRVEEDCEIAGYQIPAGATLNISIYAIHHDPEYWPEPYKFNPDRFLPEEKEKRHPYAFLAFGHGPRNCIGMRLAYLEAKAAIASILQKYRLVKCDETEVPVQCDTTSNLVRPLNGIKLRVEPRS